jgi:endogenous inhibitor of DNA gyrase (YacG/DUF329 family)
MEDRRLTGVCPICGGKRGLFGENGFFPFCCSRCRLIDLGRWLGEEYFIPEDKSVPIPDDENA